MHYRGKKKYVALARVIVLLFRQERARYYLNREKARQEPHRYLSIIIDGMDLRTHVTGAILHGRRSFAFIDVQTYFCKFSSSKKNCHLCFICNWIIVIGKTKINFCSGFLLSWFITRYSKRYICIAMIIVPCLLATYIDRTWLPDGWAYS